MSVCILSLTVRYLCWLLFIIDILNTYSIRYIVWYTTTVQVYTIFVIIQCHGITFIIVKLGQMDI